MAGIYRPDDPFEVYSAHNRAYTIVLRAETSSSAAPDGAEPDANVTWARVSNGSYTAVISTGAPLEVLAGIAYVEEIASTSNGYLANFTGYAAATGTVSVEVFEVSSASGMTLSNVDNQTLVCLLYCRRT